MKLTNVDIQGKKKSKTNLCNKWRKYSSVFAIDRRSTLDIST